MTKYWTELTKQLNPYVPGEQRSGHGIVKLNTNENPYPPSPAVLTAIAAVAGDQLRLYPDPAAAELCRTLAHYHALNENQVFVGNGSDEVLALAFMAFFMGNKPLQYPEISYSFYPVYCDLLNIEQKTVPLNSDFSIDFSLYEKGSAGVIIANPNAPTGMAVKRDDIAAFLEEHSDTVLLVDEAYVDFGAQSCIELINRYPNLLVVQTFSKGRSMAGVRLGTAFGDANLIEALQRVKNSFNSYPVDALAQAAGIASIKDEAYFCETVDKVVTTRTWLTEQLTQRGFTVLPSFANFVFASAPAGRSGALYEHLSDNNILVRYWAKPTLDNWLRISIGTDVSMQQLINEIDVFLARNNPV